LSNIIKFHSKFKPIIQEDHRFKIAHGGRYGLKSWTFARYFLLRGASKTIRVLCAREIQRSISESVHALLEKQVKLLSKQIPKLADHYTVKKNEIVGKNGTKFNFLGLYTNQTQVKSYEDYDYLWVEEAESISQNSWDLAIPTFRKMLSKCCDEIIDVDESGEAIKYYCSSCKRELQDNKNDIWKSEIWVAFNPARDDDPTYEMFITNQQPDSVVVETSYKDNKWFPLSPDYKSMEFMKKNNYSKYLHIWEGQPITDYDTLVYRFTPDNRVEWEPKYNEGLETWASWDFGVSDDTAIIFYHIYPTPENEFGYWIDVFDEYVNNNQPADHYRDIVDSKGYLIDKHACDPSGANRQADLSTWVDKLQKNKYGTIDWHFQYTHKYSVAEMIDRANDIVPYIRYNQHKTPHFHKMANRWSYRTDKDGKIVLPPKPEHDEFSHVGTSFYYFIVNRFPPRGNQKVRILK
jgi:phage terminase large subunit